MILENVRSYFAKLAEPQPAYDENKPDEWSIEVGGLTDEQVEQLTKAGIGSYVKNNGNEKGNFVRFRRSSVKQDGESAKPIEVIDDHGNPWDMSKAIGNGSVVNVKFAINEWSFGKKKGLKPSLISVQVWDHKAYSPGKNSFPVKVDAEQASSSDAW